MLYILTLDHSHLTHTIPSCLYFFFFNDTATTEIYTLSLHDALPISRPRTAARRGTARRCPDPAARTDTGCRIRTPTSCTDRKSTRLNSSHDQISYAVFCLKKKKQKTITCNHDYTLSIANTISR